MHTYRIYVNGEYAFTVTKQPSAWAAEATARSRFHCLPSDTVTAYLENPTHV